MRKIREKIKIKSLIQGSKKVFINQEITPFVSITLPCCKCDNPLNFRITPYETGYGFGEFYKVDKVLTKNQIIENRIATYTSEPMAYHGELTVNDLPTLYFSASCSNCKSDYLVVFGYGEKQPGLTILELSGIWLYTMEY